MIYSDNTRFSLPESVLIAGLLVRFDFSFLNKITDELPNNFRFIEMVEAASEEIKRQDEAGSLKADATEIADAVKFLQQEVQAATIAFNNKNSVIKL